MYSVINKALFFFFLTIFHYKFIMAGTIAPSEEASQNIFAGDLFSVIVDNKTTKNVVFSPASIQTSLTLAFIGAEGETAEEMRKVLKLGQGDKRQVMKKYGAFLKTAFKTSNSSNNTPQLKMANRLYVNSDIKVVPEFNKIAQEFFESHAENVDFNSKQKVVKKINQWVEQQTEHKIKNLLQPDVVTSDTSAVLVNAIYFKAKWLKPFSESSTSKLTFHTNKQHQMEVDTMYTDDSFGYAELPELEATALEMPYKNSDLSMLIILPNEIEGLAKLETKLKGLDLNAISSQMEEIDIDVFLPKFRIEFDIDLKKPLQNLGLRTMFKPNANFESLFETDQPQMISDVKHKAFLDVNEAGSEAAASTYIKVALMSLKLQQKVFRADHPFVFAIRSKTSVYFAGHVAKF